MKNNDKKIKICLISRSAYPLFNPDCKVTFGGAEVDLYILGKKLAEDETFDVNFIVGNFGQKKIEIYNQIKVHRGYKFKANKFLQITILIIKIIAVKTDIYIQEGASGGTGVIAFLCAILGKKFIYRTASDIDCDGTFIKKKIIEGILYRWGLKYADLIIVQNKNNYLQLKAFLNLESQVIKNGLEIPIITPKNKETILWVARSEELKQPFLFLDIAKRFPVEKFVMVCPISNYNSVDINKLKTEAKNLSNVDFVSYVPFHNINKYYEQAKVFISTSIYEGFPNTFVQAALNATPVLTLNVNPDHFLDDYKCGYCARNNFSDLVAELNSILNDKTKWEIMSKNIYNYALNNNDIDKIIGEYKNIFFKILSV